MSGISKNELENKTFETAGILSKAGVTVSIITDAQVTQQEYLGPAAGFAVKYGMDRFEALKAITINPAKHLGIEDRVGPLEAGKDADIIIADGDIMLNTTTVLKVIIDGKLVVGE
jgi:imidazolonepropionase-like amidohydrolase